MNKKSILGVAAVLISAFMLNAEEKVTFTVEGETPVTETFSVSVENMHLKFTNDIMPAKFIAGYKTDAAWYVWAKHKITENEEEISSYDWYKVNDTLESNTGLKKSDVEKSLDNAYSASSGKNITCDYDYQT